MDPLNCSTSEPAIPYIPFLFLTFAGLFGKPCRRIFCCPQKNIKVAEYLPLIWQIGHFTRCSLLSVKVLTQVKA